MGQPRWENGAGKQKASERCREVSEGAAGGCGAPGGTRDQVGELFIRTCFLLQLPGLVLDRKSSFMLSGKCRRSLCDRARGFGRKWASERVSNREWVHLNREPVFPSQGQNP